MRGFGGMLAFELKCSPQEAVQVAKNLKVGTLAASLGGVETVLWFGIFFLPLIFAVSLPKLLMWNFHQVILSFYQVER
jgi:hypothetical protein